MSTEREIIMGSATQLSEVSAFRGAVLHEGHVMACLQSPWGVINYKYEDLAALTRSVLALDIPAASKIRTADVVFEAFEHRPL